MAGQVQTKILSVILLALAIPQFSLAQTASTNTSTSVPKIPVRTALYNCGSYGEEAGACQQAVMRAASGDQITVQDANAACPATNALCALNNSDAAETIAEETAEAGPAAEGCESAFKKAKTMCDPFGGAGFSGPSSIFIEQMITGQITQSIAQSCKAAKNVNMVMTGLSAARAGMCKTAMNSCLRACPAETQQSPQSAKTVEYRGKCEGYEGMFMMQVMQALQYSAQFLASKSCQQQASNNNGGVNPGTAPTPPSFEVNCNDPAQKTTNPVCICRDNPRNSQCNPFASSGAERGLASMSSGAGRGDGSMSSGFDAIGSDDGILGPPVGSDAGNSASKVSEIPNGGGGGPQGGGGMGVGGGGAGSGGDAGQGSSGFKTDMMSGAGGGGGAGFAGYGRRKDDDGEGSSALDKLKGMLNIKDALPDKDALARGLAGMSKEAAADGVTGAMGETLWQKATRQYKNQESRGNLLSPRQ